MTPPDRARQEADKIRQRYRKRQADSPLLQRYSLLNPAALHAQQERQRAIIQTFKAQGMTDLPALRLLEVGAGTGGNLLEFLRLGFKAEHLVGIELLEDRAQLARACLPAQLRVLCGDATQLALADADADADAGFDIVYQSVVFSSILDDGVQQQLAQRMWQWVRPGGGVLWYDFIFNNPNNPDVRAVPLARVRALFPGAQIHARRLTLAPPISRRVGQIHPGLCSMFGAIPWLRTHVLCWIKKPSA